MYVGLGEIAAGSLTTGAPNAGSDNRFTPLFQDHPGEPVPEENFWCKGRLTEADTLTIRLGATPSGLTSAHLHHPPIFFTGRMPFLPPNQQCQSTEGQMQVGWVKLHFLPVEAELPQTPYYQNIASLLVEQYVTCQLSMTVLSTMFNTDVLFITHIVHISLLHDCGS